MHHIVSRLTNRLTHDQQIIMNFSAFLCLILSAVFAFGYQQTSSFASRRSIAVLKNTTSDLFNSNKALDKREAEIDDPTEWGYTMSTYTPDDPDIKLTYYRYVLSDNAATTIAQLAVNTVSDTMDQDLLYINDINMDRDPNPLRFKASDLLLGFWKFNINRDINALQRLMFNTVIEDGVVASAKAAYATMGKTYGSDNLEVVNNSNDKNVQAAYLELSENNIFGKMAGYMISDYEGMAERNLLMTKINLLMLKDQDGNYAGSFNMMITFGKG